MNIIECGKALVEHLWELAKRSVWDWWRCLSCGSAGTVKYGTWTVRPWRGGERWGSSATRAAPARRSLGRRRPTWKSRPFWCVGVGTPGRCIASPLTIGNMGGQFAATDGRVRAVVAGQAGAMADLLGGAGRQGEVPSEHGTLHRWLDKAGIEARKTVPGQLEG